MQLRKIYLHDLTEVERKNLQRIALDRINQLNIGVPIKLPLGKSFNEIKKKKNISFLNIFFYKFFYFN